MENIDKSASVGCILDSLESLKSALGFEYIDNSLFSEDFWTTEFNEEKKSDFLALVQMGIRNRIAMTYSVIMANHDFEKALYFASRYRSITDKIVCLNLRFEKLEFSNNDLFYLAELFTELANLVCPKYIENYEQAKPCTKLLKDTSKKAEKTVKL